MSPQTPLKRLAELYRASRRALMSADDHELCQMHAQELEKALTPKPKRAKDIKP